MAKDAYDPEAWRAWPRSISPHAPFVRDAFTGSFTIKVNWVAVRRYGLTYLMERVQGQKGWTEFGPMCPVIVEPFVEERRAYYSDMAYRACR